MPVSVVRRAIAGRRVGAGRGGGRRVRRSGRGGIPFAGFGACAAALERRCYADRRTAGAAHTAVMVAGAVGLGVAVEAATRRRPVAHAVATLVATWAVLGGTSLATHGRALAAGARRAVAPGRRRSVDAEPRRGQGTHPNPLRTGPAVAGRGGDGQGGDRVDGREHLRRRGRPASVGCRGRHARSARLPRDQHPRRDGRVPLAALPTLRLGGRARRRRGEPRAVAGHRAPDRRARSRGRWLAARGAGGMAPRRPCAPEPERGPGGGRDRGRAPRRARRPDRLRARNREPATLGSGPPPTPSTCAAPPGCRGWWWRRDGAGVRRWPPGAGQAGVPTGSRAPSARSSADTDVPRGARVVPSAARRPARPAAPTQSLLPRHRDARRLTPADADVGHDGR